MDYKKSILDNGLRLITIPMDVSSMTLVILVGAGSRYESPETNGVTHFLEHMLFKGTKKRPSARKLSEVIDGIGGEWNASTGKEATSYYIKTSAKHTKTAFDILCDMVTNPLLSPKEIEKEKGVIRAEIAMYEDTPSRRIGDLFETLIFPDSSLGWDIAGTPQTVSGIKREDFDHLYSQFYQPENIVVAVAGGIKEHEVKKLTEKYFGKLKVQSERFKVEKEKFIQDEPRVLVHEKKTDQAHIILGVRGNSVGHPDRWVEDVLSVILGGGMSSRLWVEVRERRALAYYVGCGNVNYRDNGYLSVSAGVDPQKATEAIKVILSEFDKARSGKINPRELTKAKEYIKGHLALSLESTGAVAGSFGGSELLEDRIITPQDMIEGVEKVEIADIVRVAKEFFVAPRLNMAIIGPYGDGEKFKGMLQL